MESSAAGAILRCCMAGSAWFPLSLYLLLVFTQQSFFLQVYIQTWGAPSLSLSINRDEYPDAPLVLRGINSQGASSQQYQPILMMSKSYTMHWNGPAPREVVLSLINFDRRVDLMFGTNDLWLLDFHNVIIQQPESIYRLELEQS